MTDQQTESMLQALGKNAPRVTPDDLEAAILSEHYFTAAEGVVGNALHVHDFETGDFYGDNVPVHESLNVLTICVLVCRNGFVLVGKSACASPENFDAEIGCRIARNDAKQQLWPLLGYTLKTIGRVGGTYGEQSAANAAQLQAEASESGVKRVPLTLVKGGEQ